MTAVASPPSFQPLSRWNGGNGGQGALDSMNVDDVSRMFMPRRSAQRTNSSSSVLSTSSGSSTYTVSAAPSQMNNESPATNGDQGGWIPPKKPVKRIWPSSKAEPVSALSTARPQPQPTPSSGQSAASTMSAMHQPPTMGLPLNLPQPQPQQNGGRLEPKPSSSDPPAVLALLPMTGTFERKHITVPYFPEVLRIGRQTNAKTVPTAVNGYFDSKVLSRQHAEVWADRNGKVWIRDVKSSNGTFVNGVRLSPENRDSEPHELREQDTLELGIDIVSEDQKSIVHHKVSAKVEHAGIYNNGSNALDLNFGEIDPSANGLNGGSAGQPGSQARGRGGSQGPMGSNGRTSGPSSTAGGNVGAMGPSRQMNFWMSPITIEEVVKKLTTELKQAKQQSQDLHRTSDFFSTLLALGPGEECPKPPSDLPKEESRPGGISPASPDAISPFSQPPAPPPQQPLPEKPDTSRLNALDSVPHNSLKRTETERPRSPSSSPVKPDPPSSQILSLVEALTTAKREIDSQGDRVKELETLLRKERKARESAEERARRLLEAHRPDLGRENGVMEAETSEPALDSPKQSEQLLTNGCDTDHEETFTMHSPILTTSEDSTIRGDEELQHDGKSVDESTSRLQERLDLMVREMDDMKVLMESYKHRAEGAERERKSLAEMIERIRADNSASSNVSNLSNPIESSDTSSTLDASVFSRPESSPGRRSRPSSSASSPSATLQPKPTDSPDSEDRIVNQDAMGLQQGLSTALQNQERQGGNNGDVTLQSAPYLSMVGVVLIGVGIMTWLNGWQKGDR